MTIIFYAIVDNYSDKSCIACREAFSIFKKFGLDMVHIESLGEFEDYDKLCDQLESTFKQVAKSPIAKDEEGNVLYFIKKCPKTGKELEVLSLAKLKTLEYRLFRKMREKLRGFFCTEGKAWDHKAYKSIVHKFKTESQALVEEGESSLPQPLDYYVSIFEKAFDFITNNPSQADVLRNEYVTFSENLLNFIDKSSNGAEMVSKFFLSDILEK